MLDIQCSLTFKKQEAYGPLCSAEKNGSNDYILTLLKRRKKHY